METDPRLKRHADLWEAQNTQVKRVVLASVAFGTLLLFNVLTPYSGIVGQRDEKKRALDIAVQEERRIDDSTRALTDFQNTSAAVHRSIAQQPWMATKDQLVRRLAEINSRGQGTPERYQREADDTLRAIGSQVRAAVLTPLTESLNKVPSHRELLPDLSAELGGLPDVIQEWERQNLGKRWYGTLDEKTQTVSTLTSSLDIKLTALQSAIQRDRPKLDDKKRELSKQRSDLREKSKEDEDKIRELEAKMETILPEWVRGLVSVQQMIQLYPFIILGLVIYVLGIALSLTGHYQFVAHSMGYEEAAETDPVLSSLWTLTYRGRLGTAATLTAYLVFVVAMWMLFEKGAGILQSWVRTEGGGFASSAGFAAGCWIARGVLLVAAVSVVAHPAYRRHKLPISPAG
jgi:hypothetical protein